MAEPKSGTDKPTASFLAVTGREPNIVAANQARLADLIVLSHPAGAKEVSSSDALHAVYSLILARPVLIATAAPCHQSLAIARHALA